MNKRAGTVLRLATPIRAWAQRFAFLLLLLATFAVMLVGKADVLLIERARVAVTDAISPILDAASRPVASFNQGVDNIVEVSRVMEENAALRQEIDRLSRWEQQALTLQGENEKLRELLRLVPEPGIDYVTARVIGDQSGVFSRAVLINAGALAGVKRGQAALTGEGLAGRVAEVGQNSARVLLLTDLNSRVPVLVGEGRHHAVLAGDNSNRPGLLFLPPGTQISVGQRIITSGEGGVFPKGLPVGLVVETGEKGARVEPFADWNHMEYLRVVDYELPGILKLDERVVEGVGQPGSAGGASAAGSGDGAASGR